MVGTYLVLDSENGKVRRGGYRRKQMTLLLGFGVVILGGVATVEGLWPHPLETPPSLAEEPMRYGCVRPGQLLGAAGRCQVLCAGPPASLAGGRVLPWLRQCGSYPERA